MKYLYLITLLTMYGSLSGCSSTIKAKTPEPASIIVTKVKLLDPPIDLIKKCHITKPVDETKYVNFNFDEKEDSLTELVINLYTDLGKCNNQLASLRGWYIKQKEIYKEKE